MITKISYSLLKTFETGTTDDVINLYLRLDGRVTPQMERGKRFDEMTREHIKNNNALPPELGGKKLNNPISDKDRLKFVVPYKEYLLSAEFDTIDGSDLYEFKDSSIKDSAEYSNDYQVDFYFLVSAILSFDSSEPWTDFDRAYIFRHDPIFPNRYDHSLVWNSESRVKNISNKIDELGPRITQLLKDHLE